MLTVAVNKKFMFRCKGDSIAFEERTARTMNAVHLSTNESRSPRTCVIAMLFCLDIIARTVSYSVAAVKCSRAWLLAALKGSLR